MAPSNPQSTYLLVCAVYAVHHQGGLIPDPRSRVVLTLPVVADHYGPAEILFGQVREDLPDDIPVLGGTKWCVFKEITPSREVVEEAVRERMSRMRSINSVDLLQVSNSVRRLACATLMCTVPLS